VTTLAQRFRPGSVSSLPFGIPAAGLSFVVGAAVALRAQVALGLTALACGVVLIATPAEIVVLLGLLGRDLADAHADVAVAGGLNAGAFIGVAVVAVTAARVATGRAGRGAAAAAFLGLLLILWFIVGYTNFGLVAPLERELIRQLSIVAVGVLAANTARFHPRTRLVDVIVATTAVEAVVAVYQFLTGQGFEGTNRAWGTLSHPSTAAALFTVGLALALFQYFEGRRRRYLLVALLLAVALLATRSLGGLAQAPVTLVAYGVFAGRLNRRVRTAALLGVAVLLLFVFTGFGSGRIQELSRTTSLSQASHGHTTNALDWRYYQWTLLLKDWKDKPVLGWGLGTTDSYITPQDNIPHNDFLRLLVETGVIGFIVFGTGWFVLVRTLRQRMRIPGPARSLQAITLAVVVGLTVNSIVNNVNFMTSTMYATAALIGCALAPRLRELSEPAAR
jgi:O-antigen ligase